MLKIVCYPNSFIPFIHSFPFALATAGERGRGNTVLQPRICQASHWRRCLWMSSYWFVLVLTTKNCYPTLIHRVLNHKIGVLRPHSWGVQAAKNGFHLFFLIVWLVVWNINSIFPLILGCCHHPNWRTHIFQVAKNHPPDIIIVSHYIPFKPVKSPLNQPFTPIDSQPDRCCWPSKRWYDGQRSSGLMGTLCGSNPHERNDFWVCSMVYGELL